MYRIVVVWTLCMVFFSAAACFSAGRFTSVERNVPQGQECMVLEDIPVQPLSEEELEALLHLCEEEKLARDVYTGLLSVWGEWIFDHIALSESRHMASVEQLLARYGVESPGGEDSPGFFDDDELQNLYEELIDQGSLSLVDALRVGATIEDLDIFDLQQILDLTDNEDVILVCENLQRGSRNHLRSFVYQLSLLDELYNAQYLTQQEVDAIVDSPLEKGGAAF